MFQEIQNNLQDENKLKYIVASVSPYKKHPTHNRYLILAWSENKEVIWQKYSGPSIGSDNNLMFFFDKDTQKYKQENTSHFVIKKN